MSILSPDDYYKEHKKFNKVKSHTRSKYHGGIAISTKIKYPSQHKSKPVFCRNCNKQNISTAKICIQCECTMSSKPMRRRMK